MTDSPTTVKSIFIRHEQIPISYLINLEQSENDDANSLVLNCQISSNFYFYAAFLNELSSSSQFTHLFSQLLNRLTSLSNRKHLHHIFSITRHHRNRFYLQVHPYIKQYDLRINRLWASIQLHVLTKRIRYESSWAWLSTLGGGHSCLGEENLRHAKEAEEISKNQIGLSTEVGDPNAIIKSYLFLSLSYLQQKRYDNVRIILRYQYRRIQEKDITDERLPIMCIALWKKMKYAMKKDQKQNLL